VKDDCVYLLHIRDAVNRIFEYSKGGAEEFLRDTKTQDAVVRNLKIIGEAVKHISERLRTQHPDLHHRQCRADGEVQFLVRVAQRLLHTLRRGSPGEDKAEVAAAFWQGN
jgi:hypothetical protein